MKLCGPMDVPWCTPWNPTITTIPDNNITKSANHSTGVGETQRRERLLVFLPLGGGKLRCRDVLGLGSGRGSCLNPEGWGKSGVGEKMKQREVVGEAFLQGCSVQGWNVSSIGLWCWFRERVVSCITLAVSWFWFKKWTKRNLYEWPNGGYRPKCDAHNVRSSVSHYDSWVSGEPTNWKTQSVSFQHMVNLVLNHSTCQVKSIQRLYHSTPFFRNISLSQIQRGQTPCCRAQTCLATDFHVFKPKSKGCMLLFFLGNTLKTLLLGSFISPFKY